jgi:hypothetical protein
MRTLMARRLAIGLFAAALFASSALAAPGDSERRALTAHDQAWAKRVNLTLRDLPGGFRQGPQNPTGSGGLTCSGFAPDLSRFTITGQAASRQFARSDGVAIFSAAEIFRSTGDQHGDWAATARREALPCIRDLLQQAVGSSARVASTSLRSAPRLGERTISFRATMVVSGNGVKATIWLDMLAVAQGRGDATLGVLTVRKAPSASLERSLLAKLASRLRG